MTEVWISAAGLCGATVIGSLIGFLIKELPHKWNDTVLGFCAGVMLAAACLGLLGPAFSMATGHNRWLVPLAGMAGAFFLELLDLFTPHLHHITGLEAEQHAHNKTLNHVMLFVMAIALHKLPEGMAAGVSMSDLTDGNASWLVSMSIAIQNIPEGMVIIAPLLVAGVSRMRTFVLSLAIGLLEVVGVWIGFGLGYMSSTWLPAMLSFAGGAMLYVTSDEMIPETHAHGYQKQATYALLLGFITILMIETWME